MKSTKEQFEIFKEKLEKISQKQRETNIEQAETDNYIEKFLPISIQNQISNTLLSSLSTKNR
jgi:hypothetical protein